MLDSLAPLKGTLDLLVLQALAWAPMHGFEITSWLEARSGAAGATLTVDAAAVYQALYRLEGRDLVTAEWGVSERGRRARYYRLTARGRAQRRAEVTAWRRYTAVVDAILDPAPDGAAGVP